MGAHSTKPNIFSRACSKINSATPTCRLSSTQVSRDIGGAVRISSLCPTDELIDTPFDGVETLYDAFQRGLTISRDKPCLGYRNGGSAYVWITYAELEERARNFGSGLIAQKITPKMTEYIGIIGINCVDWVVAQLGSVFYNIVFVPMYDTLGDEAMNHILQQTECQLIVAHPSKVGKVQTFLNSGPHKVRVVVKMCEDPTGDERDEYEKLGVVLQSMGDIEQLGKESPMEMCAPCAEDLYTICYTSGTTGIPKGAMISHQNMTTTMAGVIHTNPDFKLTSEDVHFSYLPLCHLFEMNIHMFTYTAGACIGFYSGNPLEIPEDIRILRPSVFPAVPRVLNKFQDKIKKGITEKGFIAQWLFDKAMSAKLADLNNGVRRKTIWDTILLQKIRDAFGGRISLIATGAAPVLPETLNFFRVVFGANVYEGFGQTESTAGCTFTQPGDYTGGHVGPPLPSNYIKLVDSPETGHFVADGKGEVCVKGKSVFMGYYKAEELTKQAIDEEGWLHTGDIGQWNAMGCLQIIDRKKNIFKTSLGEYIAPEKIENVYELNDLVQQMFIDGDSTKPKIAAIVIPDEERFVKWAAGAGKDGLKYEQMLEDPDLNSKYLTLLNKAAQTKLKSFELVAKIRLVDVAVTVENDLVTPTFKKKRPFLKRRFSEMFDVMYSEIH